MLDSDIPSTMMGLDHAEAYRELIKGLNLPFEDWGIAMQDQDIALETLPTILNRWGASLDGYNIRVKDLVESPPSFPTFAKVLTSGYYIFRAHKGVSKDLPEGADGLDNDIAELIELFNLLLKLEVTTSKKPEEGEIYLVELLRLPQRLENLLGKMRKFGSDLILSTEKKGNIANNPDHKPKDLPFNLFKAQIVKIEELIKRFKALKLSTNIKIPLL